MMTDSCWPIWLANVKFKDKPGHKKRPIIILKDGSNSCQFLYVTSKIKDDLYGYRIVHWEYAKLDKPSMAMLEILNIPNEDIIHIIGTLHEEDQKNLLIALGHSSYCSSY